MEIFRDIPGYEGLYKITSWGRVWSCYNNKFMVGDETPKGYLRVKLFKDGKGKNYKVHRLVANSFIENVYNLPQVNHKDGNKHNNSFTNLEWCTDEENKRHRKMLYAQK